MNDGHDPGSGQSFVEGSHRMKHTRQLSNQIMQFERLKELFIIWIDNE